METHLGEHVLLCIILKLLRISQRPMMDLPITETASECLSHGSRKKGTSLPPVGVKGCFWLDSQQTEGSWEGVWIDAL